MRSTVTGRHYDAVKEVHKNSFSDCFTRHTIDYHFWKQLQLKELFVAHQIQGGGIGRIFRSSLLGETGFIREDFGWSDLEADKFGTSRFLSSSFESKGNSNAPQSMIKLTFESSNESGRNPRGEGLADRDPGRELLRTGDVLVEEEKLELPSSSVEYSDPESTSACSLTVSGMASIELTCSRELTLLRACLFFFFFLGLLATFSCTDSPRRGGLGGRGKGASSAAVLVPRSPESDERDEK